MKPLRAWAIFLFVVGVPTAFAVVFALLGAKNERDGRSGRLHEQHVASADRIRERLELTQRRGEEVLRRLPPFSSPRDAEDALAAVDLAMARIVVRMPGEPTPASPWMYRTVKADGDSFSMGANGTTDILVSARVSGEVEVGFVIDRTTIEAGVGLLLEPEQALVRREPGSVQPPRGRKGVPWGTPFQFLTARPLGVTDRSVVVTPFLVFDVDSRDPAKAERNIRWGAYSAIARWAIAYASMLLVAVVLFARTLKAQRLAELRTDFVAAVSHELRTPLASVRMFAELLEANAVPLEERPEVEQALAMEARRLHATLERMLRFGALSRGKLVVSRALAHLEPIAREVATKAKLPVRVEVDPALNASVDAGLLALAVENLVSNAVKYAPGDILLSLREEGADLVIDVTDRGPGLDRKALRRIFLPFERADDRLSRATEGTGVGLSLVRGIARAHGGDATAASVPGAGSTFTLRFPRA